ncbi:MAG: hypothetical protein HZB75_00460 [Candidatus Saccharibacteria bacterium]|nr:MAG: hypothetical protein HZB75_00460 [Candidatus Saccharibacteria bacterium]
MNIYFSGVGGVGVGPLAEIAQDAGYGVQGSDRTESLTTRELRSRGIPVNIGQDGEFLQSCHESQPIDWFVYTSALPKDHPELVLARQLGIKTAKRDELLTYIIADKNLKLIAVAGTHGKTTTTGMMIWTLQELGIPVSYSVGTTLSFGPSGKYNPDSEYFVYECDEFDRNFLHFSPNVALITSLGYDHPDTYPTEGAYREAFMQFITQSTQTIMWQYDSNAFRNPPLRSWTLQDNEAVHIPLAGAHNRRNATLVMKALEFLHLTTNENALDILSRFPGTDRRFEKLADNVYSDYGHHPSEIAATLQMARELSEHVTLVYQPHQNVRQHEIKAHYTDCFMLAEEVFWLPTYLSREDPALPILTPDDLIRDIANKDVITIAELDDALWEHIEDARAKGNLVLAMGAGSIDAWLRSHIKN